MVQMAHEGWHPENEILNSSEKVLAVSVSDTGIGIPAEKQQIICPTVKIPITKTERSITKTK